MYIHLHIMNKTHTHLPIQLLGVTIDACTTLPSPEHNNVDVKIVCVHLKHCQDHLAHEPERMVLRYRSLRMGIREAGEERTGLDRPEGYLKTGSDGPGRGPVGSGMNWKRDRFVNMFLMGH